MNSSTPKTHDAGFSDHELMKWQVRVAQRADKLRAAGKPGPEDDRATWLRAEAEVFERRPGDLSVRGLSR